MTTAPDLTVAERLAAMLVEARLAACVHIMPLGTSVYRWQGAVERAAEHSLLIKSTYEHFHQIEATLRAHHPYEIPEIICQTIDAGSPGYLQWLDDSVQT
mgnify:FL=1